MPDLLSDLSSSGEKVESKKSPRRSHSVTNFKNLINSEHVELDENKNAKSVDVDGIKEIPIDQIDMYSKQSRKHFDDENLSSLSHSIKNHGLANPLKLVKKGDRFQVVSGERRLRACSLAGIRLVKSIIVSEDEALITSVLDNLHRDNLHILEEAMDYQKLLDARVYANITELSEGIGVSRTVASEKLTFLREIGQDEALKIIKKGDFNSREALRSHVKKKRGRIHTETTGEKNKSRLILKVTSKGDEITLKSENLFELDRDQKSKLKEKLKKFIESI